MGFCSQWLPLHPSLGDVGNLEARVRLVFWFLGNHAREEVARIRPLRRQFRAPGRKVGLAPSANRGQRSTGSACASLLARSGGSMRLSTPSAKKPMVAGWHTRPVTARRAPSTTCISAFACRIKSCIRLGREETFLARATRRSRGSLSSTGKGFKRAVRPARGRLLPAALCVTYPSANKALQESRELVGARR
jgi:hypothetical protein